MLNKDGSECPRWQWSGNFSPDLTPLQRPSIVFWNERLSTMAVTRDMIGVDPGAQNAPRMVDSVAAFILQGVLDSLNRR